MPKKSSFEIDITDGFCGAGGSSDGAEDAGKEMGIDVKVRLGLNHWKRAIETHSANFPHADHECTDISAADPRRYKSTRIAIWSPECTNMGLAQGKKQIKKQLDLYEKMVIDPAAERSRATMWDVPRFAEYHNYELIIVENVVEARSWRMYDAWLMAMRSLGYLHETVYANSQFFYPCPQSRDRMYVVFWKAGNKKPNLAITPNAWCPKCEKDISAMQTWKSQDKKYGKYGKNGQYVYCCPACATVVLPYYFAAFNCIDWSDRGTRIADRPRPLKPNTIARAQYGLDKYGDQVIIINDGHSTGIDFRVRTSMERLDTVTSTPHFKIMMPFIMKGEHTTNKAGHVKSAMDALQTQTGRQSMSVLMPMILEMNRTGKAKPVTDATSTFTSGGVNHSLLLPFILTNKGTSKARSVGDPLSGVTTVPSQGLVSHESFHSFLAYNYSGNQVSHITDPIDTMSTKSRASVISYKKPKLEDCYYRMLKTHEIQKAMAFRDNYLLFGNSKEKVKLLGNAVTPPVMKTLVKRCVETLL